MSKRGKLRLALLCSALAVGYAQAAGAAAACPAKMDCEGNLAGQHPSAATVVEFNQALDADGEDYFQVYDKEFVSRRYLRYVPTQLPEGDVPLLIVFHGANIEAETLAVYETYLDFERLADEKKFILVYANAYSRGPAGGWKYPGVWRACRAAHEAEAPDVSYVREIVKQLGRDYRIDRRRIYAAGVSNGGGMVFGLAMEAPDLVAAIVAGIPEPFSPAAPRACKVQPGHAKVPVMMLAGTDDPLIDYVGSGMERIRDQWRGALKTKPAQPTKVLPDRVAGDAMKLPSSHLERTVYPASGPGQAEMLYYKAVGAGHAIPHPRQMDAPMWPILGKRNQDASFAELVWDFVKAQRKAE